MANSVCLTEKQKKFYNYFVNYYKSNGFLPNMSQTARDMKVHSGTAAAVYGALLLKGVFTRGQALTRLNRARHNTVSVQALNIADIKVDIKPRERKVAQTVANNRPVTNKQLADLLVKLLSGGDTSRDGAINAILANL